LLERAYDARAWVDALSCKAQLAHGAVDGQAVGVDAVAVLTAHFVAGARELAAAAGLNAHPAIADFIFSTEIAVIDQAVAVVVERVATLLARRLKRAAHDLAGLAARGEVVGIDLNPKILEVAQQHARDRGFSNVSFKTGDIRNLELDGEFDGEFDAVVGRFVLMYLKEPSEGLNQALPYLKPGGVVAQIEVDYTVPVASRPASELYQNLYRWTYETFRRGGVHLNMAMRLPEVFHSCALPSPQLQIGTIIGSGPEFVQQFAAYAAAVLRSLLPRLVEYSTTRLPLPESYNQRATEPADPQSPIDIR
jgi:hypothetical protein